MPCVPSQEQQGIFFLSTHMATHPPKSKKFSITLSEREVAVLSLYARRCNCSRPLALRRIVKAGLRSCAADLSSSNVSPNQLSLFQVTNQTNLLDEISSNT